MQDKGPGGAFPGGMADDGDRPVTGEPVADRALERLDELAGLPPAEHAPVYEHVLARLREALGELDSEPGRDG